MTERIADLDETATQFDALKQTHTIVLAEMDDLRRELAQPRSNVRGAVQAERVRCDTTDRKKIVDCEKKIRVLQLALKKSERERAAAVSSASKAKRHWEQHREQDFTDLGIAVQCWQFKNNELERKNTELRRQLKESGEQLNKFNADINKLPGVLDQLETKTKTLKQLRSLFRRRQLAHQKNLHRMREEGNTFVKDVQDYQEEVLEEQAVEFESVEEIRVLVNEGGTNTVWPFSYEMFTMKMLMHGTPASVARSQQCTIDWLEEIKCLKVDHARFSLMPLRTMRQIRENAPQWVLFLGGIDIMRAKRLLAFYFDETEIDTVSVLSVIKLIEDEHMATSA